ncbi:hypothetical protein ABW20_dc0100139 [Dactylellina cionopaga]|nr:hypothetical protein ABW20_dc0100139 [Dactylellina cionopaga]
MSGNNAYNENSGQQYLAMEASLPLFADLELGSNVTIADYGCSQGAASVAVMKRLVARLAPHSIVTLSFNDLPSNDFNSLIQLLPDIAPSDPTITIYHSISPQSFYEPVFANSTVDIAFALSSAHWMRQIPAPKPTNETAEEFLSKRRARNAPAAHRDLLEFLNLRGREIKPGGKLILAMPTPIADNNDGRISGNEKLRCAIFTAIGLLTDAGKLPIDAGAGVYPPAFVHTEETVRAAAAGTQTTWNVEKVYTKVVPHPAYQSMLELQAQTDDEGQKNAAAKRYSSIVLDWTLVVFKPFMLRWWMQRGLGAAKCEDAFQECSELAKEEFFMAGGAKFPVSQDFVFLRLGRE